MAGESRSFWIWFSVLVIASCMMAVGLVFSTINSASAKDDIVPAMADAIVLITVGDEGECTGFVSKTTFGEMVLTAGHCAGDVKENQKLTATDSNGKKYGLTTVYYDAIHDLAVMFPSREKQPSASLKLACNVPVHIGDDVTMTGFPLDFNKVTVSGKIAAEPSAWGLWPLVYRVAMFAAPGNSGSAVLNSNGDVIGILVGGRPDWPGMSMVEPISVICQPGIA